MKSINNKRWRLLADVQIQGPLILRVACYWILFQTVQVGTIAVFSFLSQGSLGFDLKLLVPSFIVSALILPLVMLDMLKFSNHFAGPMLNLRRKLKQLADDESADPIRLRPGDYYREMSDNFNEIRLRIKASENGLG